MKATVLFVIFGSFLTWLQPTEGQRDRDVRIPPLITSIFPEKYYMADVSGYKPGDWRKVIYKCDHYSGIPPPEIYWQYYLNGVFQSKLYPQNAERTYNGSELMLKTINPDEQYQCVAENINGKALSTKIRVFQARGADFNNLVKANPHPFAGNTGEHQLIPCEYKTAGIPKNIFSWKYLDTNGNTKQNVKIGDRIFVADDGSLAFSYLKLDDGNKIYYCQMENTILNMLLYGSWSKLDVSGSAEVPNMPTVLVYGTKNNTVAIYGKQFKMQCIFGGNPVPGVQWERPHSRSSNRFSGKENYELVISSVSEDDEGIYKCTGMQEFGNPKTVAFFIDVKGAPIWVKRLSSLIVAEGQDGVFFCDARPLKGEKLLEKPKWYKNGEALKITPGGISGKTELSADGKILTIHDALKRSDICNYQCSVSNNEGEIFADAAFNVILNTEVKVAPMSQTIDKGDVAMFDIYAITDPLREKVMTYTWSLNGRKIEFLDLYDIYLLANNSLVVNTTGMDDNRFQVVLGNYSVNIDNEVEVVTKYASLMGKPVKKPIVSPAGMDLRWIALIVAVVLLFIIFILLLCVLFNRHGGDDYSVDKKERKAGHDPEKELADSGFHDLPRTDEDPDRQKADNVSISSTAKSMGSEETDSMEEYSDADAGSRFNEDGSFIGAYQGHESKGNNVSNV